MWGQENRPLVPFLDSAGTAVVTYTYDAWGTHLSGTNGTGSDASTLGRYNPLRYRGYVFDTDTGLYYLQSRYYDPATRRFINADALVSTGQGLLGNNVFAYCRNNPISRIDFSGTTDEDVEQTAAEELEALLEKYATVDESGFTINIESDPAKWNSCIKRMGIKKAYDYMSNYLCKKYEEKYNKEFLFSNDCVAYEIEYHIDAYMCMNGYSGYSRNATTFLMTKNYIIDHCKIVDISTDDVHSFIQSSLFDYQGGIRDCYTCTPEDPYAKRISILGFTVYVRFYNSTFRLGY